MEEGTPFIELRICLDQPAELTSLIGAFSAIGSQFDEFIRREHPNLKGDAKLFVKEIRKGSTIVELVPVILPLIENMDRILIVDDFVTRYGGMLRSYLSGNRIETATRSDIRDFMGQVSVIATDPKGTSTISSAIFHETKSTKRIEISFDTEEARRARDALEEQKLAIDLPAHEVKHRVLMRFFQSNIGDPKIGSSRTGERVIIEAVTQKPLSLIYETERAKERLKHETGEDERNIYRKGFIVDCYVEKSFGRPVAYRVTDIHDVIELPSDDDDSPPQPQMLS